MIYKCLINKRIIPISLMYVVLAIVPACSLLDQNNNSPEYADFSLEDINPNSEYYAQDIGPSTFIDNDFVSVYYFGKAG